MTKIIGDFSEFTKKTAEKDINIITKEEHDELAKMFPKVNYRCPVCYVNNHIRYKITAVLNSRLNWNSDVYEFVEKLKKNIEEK
jgi:hypothetical protein